jgi:hypothetical protein
MSDCSAKLCFGNAIHMNWDWLHPDRFLIVSPKAARRPSRFTNRDSAGVTKCPSLGSPGSSTSAEAHMFPVIELAGSGCGITGSLSSRIFQYRISATNCHSLSRVLLFSFSSSICLQTRITSVKFYEGDEENFLSNRPL